MIEIKEKNIKINYYVNDPYLEIGYKKLKSTKEAEQLKQQILQDHEYGKSIHNGKMQLVLTSIFKEMAQNSMKYKDFLSDLDKLGMTKEMKLIIEKSFADDFKDHMQNQMLRELVEKEIEKLPSKSTKEENISKSILQQLLEEIKLITA